MYKQSKQRDAADKYMKAATKRFAKGRIGGGTGEDEFVNGFSWGAHAGYLAGLNAAKRKRTTKRT